MDMIRRARAVSASIVSFAIALSACAAESESELDAIQQAAVVADGVVYVSPGDYYFHSDSDAQNNGASGSPECDRGTDVDYWHNQEPHTDGCHVGWTQPGEIMRYALGPIVPAAGNYDIVIRLGSAFAGRKLRARLIYMADKSTPTVAQVDLTAEQHGWGVFSDGLLLSAQDFAPGAPYAVEVEHLTGELDFNGFELRPRLPSTRIEAESYFVFSDNTAGDSGNSSTCTRHDNVDLEPTSDARGGRCNVGWGEAGEWLAWYVGVPQSGDYRVVARVASWIGGRFYLDGVYDATLGTIVRSPELSVQTGDWQRWQDVIVFPSVRLISGPNRPPVWTFHITQSGVNLNYLELVPLKLCDTWTCAGQ
jgi:hypothetical protein